MLVTSYVMNNQINYIYIFFFYQKKNSHYIIINIIICSQCIRNDETLSACSSQTHRPKHSTHHRVSSHSKPQHINHCVSSHEVRINNTPSLTFITRNKSHRLNRQVLNADNARPCTVTTIECGTSSGQTSKRTID